MNCVSRAPLLQFFQRPPKILEHLSARVTTTVKVSPLTRASDRKAKRRSASRFITICRIGNDESTAAGFSAKVLRRRVKNRGLNMLCLEVAVNGERYCLAGAHGVWVVFADVASPQPIQWFGSGFDLSVHGWRDGSISRGATEPYWGESARHLNVGDVVTIRLVESNVPDSPRYPESSALVDGVVVEPELFAYSTRIPDGLAGFLFWMAVAILGIVLLYVTPHG
jgi:hypothetical protein